MESQLLTAPEEQLSDGGGQSYAHYAESASVTEGYVMGRPVLALCGMFFVPSRDPLKFPVCPACKEIVEALYLDQE